MLPPLKLRSGREVSDRYRILVVEDDALIAMELGERLEDMGYAILGPAATVAEAEKLVAGQKPDAALLDSNLAGVSSTDLAAALASQGVPVAFCTGYDSIKNLPPELKAAPILTKPIADADLLKVLKQLIS
jgi:CheY-like chemotaxis protein